LVDGCDPVLVMFTLLPPKIRYLRSVTGYCPVRLSLFGLGP
jgi:hypothetical protein